ncbi:MAG: tetratricopeptide repeat protein [Sandaracinaceae bacterium]
MSESRNVEALRRRAERAIDEGRSRRTLEPILEQILRVATEDHPARIFAHRHLAELRLEMDPWSAALHLRKVIVANPRDDIAQSLMALAQALLGNYRSAVTAYRRALQVAPQNPWYHHNLGHLLDVALNEPRAALPHLELALRESDPSEHEIAASASHCLARLGRLERARELALRACEEAPDSEDHRALLAWIDAGAPADLESHGVRAGAHVQKVPPPDVEDDDIVVEVKKPPRQAKKGAARSRTAAHTAASNRASNRASNSSPNSASNTPRDAAASTRVGSTLGAADPDAAIDAQIAELLEAQLLASGFTTAHVKQARRLWKGYRSARQVRVYKPAVAAAAVHYALTVALAIPARESQAAVAQRYGVTASALSARFLDMRLAIPLDLRQLDD